MLYTESRESSAELLRAVLSHMGRHDATFNPMTYAVWYEYAAGINSAVNQAIEHRLQTEPRLGNAAMASLYQDHIMRASNANTSRISNDLAQLMAKMASSAAATGERAGSFGVQLSSLLAALQTNDRTALPDQLHQAMSDTSNMQGATESLRR